MAGKTIEMPSVGETKGKGTQGLDLEKLDQQLMEIDNLRDAFCNMIQNEIANVDKIYDDAARALSMLNNNANAGKVLAPEFEELHLKIFMGAVEQLKSICISNLNGNAIHILNTMDRPE